MRDTGHCTGRSPVGKRVTPSHTELLPFLPNSYQTVPADPPAGEPDPLAGCPDVGGRCGVPSRPRQPCPPSPPAPVPRCQGARSGSPGPPPRSPHRSLTLPVPTPAPLATRQQGSRSQAPSSPRGRGPVHIYTTRAVFFVDFWSRTLPYGSCGRSGGQRVVNGGHLSTICPKHKSSRLHPYRADRTRAQVPRAARPPAHRSRPAAAGFVAVV